MSSEQPYNPFNCAAASGLPAGLLFTVIVLACAYSSSYVLLSPLALLLILAVPFIAYKRLATNQAKRPPVRVFQTAWIEGVYTFLFGGLIMAVLVYIWLRYLDPGFMQRQFEIALSVAQSTPGAGELARQLQTIIDHNMVPSPISSAMSLFWPVTFTGAMLSLLLALIISRIQKKNKI